MMKTLAIAALAATSSWANANIISNGSFEDPVVGSVSDDGSGIYWYGVLGGNAITGWSHPTMVVNVDRPGAWEAAHGLQYINLESIRGNYIEQSVITSPGESYTLSFSYAPDPYEAPGSTQSDIGVLFGGNQVGLASGDDDTLGNLNWINYTIVVTASSELTLLRFEDRGNGGFVGGYLDNVSLVLLPTPATMGLLLGAAPMLARRRRSF